MVEWMGILIIVCFFQRGLIRILFPSEVSYDTYYHLFMADVIRRYGITGGARYYIRRIIPSGKDRGWVYPWLYHWFLSLFPKPVFDKYVERFINPFIDSLFCYFLFLSVSKLYSPQLAVRAVLLYIFTPTFFSVQSPGPRTSGATPRLLGEILVNIVFFAEYMYLAKQNVLFGIIAVGVALLIPITSKFSLQALFFISFASCLLAEEISLIVVPLLGLALSILIFRGNCVSILKGQYRHLKWYMSMNMKGKMHVSPRNSISFLLTLIKDKGFIRGLRSYALYYNTFLISFLKFPMAWFSLYYIVFRSPKSEWGMGAIFILSSFFVFAITSLKPFLFLGEAERYLHYVLIFTLIYAIKFIPDKFLIILIFYGILWNISDVLYMTKKKKMGSLDKSVISYLKRYTFPRRVLTIPFHLGGWQILYNTPHKWFYPIMAVSLGCDERDLDMFIDRYPYLKLEKLFYMLLRYRIDMAIINIDLLERRKVISGAFSLGPHFRVSFLKSSLLIISRRLDKNTG